MGMPASMAAPKLNGMLGGLVTAFFLGHLLYGLLAGVFARLAVRSQLHATGATVSRGIESTA